MTRRKRGGRWLAEHRDDAYVRKARQEGYRSRAAYKLIELAKRDRLFRSGQVVVDLGASPGGWSQVAAGRVGAKGCVVALDIREMESLPGVAFVHGDVRDAAVRSRLSELTGGQAVQLVMSDMAPNISGVRDVDQAAALALVEIAADFAEAVLESGGTLLVKMFQGDAVENVRARLVERFDRAVVRKPEASRARSDEVYLLASGFHPPRVGR